MRSRIKTEGMKDSKEMIVVADRAVARVVLEEADPVMGLPMDMAGEEITGLVKKK
jgi:hypothetical protein